MRRKLVPTVQDKIRLTGDCGDLFGLHGVIVVPGGFRGTTFCLSAGDSFLIEGGNGAGKGTLLDVLCGNVKPSQGTISIPTAARVALLTQEVHLPSSSSAARKTYIDAVGEETAEKTPLEHFGPLPGFCLDKKVTEMSIGQQRRIALAICLANPPDLLLLDELTNHFSLALVSELEKSLETFEGTLIVASHDRWLRERWNNQKIRL